MRVSLEHTYNPGAWNFWKRTVRSSELFSEGEEAHIHQLTRLSLQSNCQKEVDQAMVWSHWWCRLRLRSLRYAVRNWITEGERKNVCSLCRERNDCWVRVSSKVSCQIARSSKKSAMIFAQGRVQWCVTKYLTHFIRFTAHRNSAGIQICPWLASTRGLC